MSKKIFTEKEIGQLSKNPYVKSVTSKAITYTDEFKKLFISENNKGKLPRAIFEECNFDVHVIGLHRVKSSGKRWRTSYRENGVLGFARYKKPILWKALKERTDVGRKECQAGSTNCLIKGGE
ncbi:MAG: tranposase [Paenibacillaceae bacterium]|nr:tranposase [Paenibacillaceae bacterium]